MLFNECIINENKNRDYTTRYYIFLVSIKLKNPLISL